MTINYNQLDYINKTIKKFPNAKLQIVSKNQDEKTVKELISKGFISLVKIKSKRRKKNLKISIMMT